MHMFRCINLEARNHEAILKMAEMANFDKFYEIVKDDLKEVKEGEVGQVCFYELDCFGVSLLRSLELSKTEREEARASALHRLKKTMEEEDWEVSLTRGPSSFPEGGSINFRRKPKEYHFDSFDFVMQE